MTLTLLAISLNEQPLSQPITAHFDSRGGSIGRADHNTMALPDPERQISRLQAEIVSSGQGFLIRNLGAANPIVVSGRWLSQNETAPLAHGDEIRIGGYLLHVDGRAQPAALEVTRGRALLSASQAAPAPSALPPDPPPPSSPPRPPPPPRQVPSPPPLQASPPVARPATLPAAFTAASSNPFADLLGGGPANAAAASDPFADLLAPPRTPSAPPAPFQARAPLEPAPAFRPPAAPVDDPFADLLPPPAGVPMNSPALASAPAPGSWVLPEGFDDLFAAPPAARPSAPAAAADPFADLIAAPPAASIDQLFGLGPAGADPLANFMAAPPAPARAGGVSTDPMEALFSSAAPAVPAAPLAYGQVLGPGAVLEAAPPPLAAPMPVAAPAVATRPPPAPAAPPARSMPPPAAGNAAPGETERLWAAFCEGAGIQMALDPAAAEQRFRDIGRILNGAVSGTLGLMAVRASTRHELRAAVTVIQARGNNPLKFSPDAGSALGYLLQPAVRGFLEGPAAMDDAMQDLMGHSIGTVAGMRAALDGMLDRFAPAELEAKLVGKSVIENLLPGHRKARLWDLYLQHHGSIREDAQEDFHTVFGKAFLAAYERQVEQLKNKSRT